MSTECGGDLFVAHEFGLAGSTAHFDREREFLACWQWDFSREDLGGIVRGGRVKPCDRIAKILWIERKGMGDVVVVEW